MKNPHRKIDLTAEATSMAEVLRQGGVVLYPTDTVWGLGCDARSSEAVNRIFAIKRRADSKALIILVDDVDRLNRYVAKVPATALRLIQETTQPLTIVYDGGCNLAPELLAEDGSVGIRVTSDPFCRMVINELGAPIVSTSANISGMHAPEVYSMVDRSIIAQTDYVADWRRSDKPKGAVPSRVIKVTETEGVETTTILRK